MLTNAFIGEKEIPTDADLIAALGPAKTLWDQLLANLARQHGAGILQWKSYNAAKQGWALRVLHKKRTIVWLAPAKGAFTVLFILGEKAVQAARAGKLPVGIVRALAEAPKYPEGTGLRLAVKSPRELGALLKLAEIKVAN